MITDSILVTLGDVLLFFLGEIDPIETPEWMNTVGTFTGTIFAFAADMGVWFNWGLLAIVLGSLIAVNLLSFGIHVVRMVASFLTGGGGKA